MRICRRNALAAMLGLERQPAIFLEVTVIGDKRRPLLC